MSRSLRRQLATALTISAPSFGQPSPSLVAKPLFLSQQQHFHQQQQPRRPLTQALNFSTKMKERKAGVASPEELKAFVESAGDKLLVVDVRNPDAEKEPGDQKSLAVAALPSDTNRPQAMHLIWDRESDSLPLPDVSKHTPIITHCGGGGRGQLARDFLMKNGFENVLNGGGPKETDCWAEFGDK